MHSTHTRAGQTHVHGATHTHTHGYACPHAETHTHARTQPHKHSRDKQLASLQQHEKTGRVEEAGQSASPSLTPLPARMLQRLRSEHWKQWQAGRLGSISARFVACVVLSLNCCQRGSWGAQGSLPVPSGDTNSSCLFVKVINAVVMRTSGQGRGRIPVFAEVVSLFSP